MVVVGSLTAGDSARIAMSTMIRTAKAGSCSIVRSCPSATMPCEPSRGVPRCLAVHVEQGVPAVHEVAHRVAQHADEVVVARDTSTIDLHVRSPGWRPSTARTPR